MLLRCTLPPAISVFLVVWIRSTVSVCLHMYDWRFATVVFSLLQMYHINQKVSMIFHLGMNKSDMKHPIL